MEEYKKALALRKEGKYEEGFEWLQKSSEAGNLFALFELYLICVKGGWGIYADVTKPLPFGLLMKDPFFSILCNAVNDILPEASCDWLKYNAKTNEEQILVAGCVSDQYNFIDKNWIIMGAEMGFAESLVQMWYETKDWRYLREAYKQKNTNACYRLFMYYWKQRCYKEAFDIYDECKDLHKSKSVALHFIFRDKITDLEAKYFVGRSAPSTFKTQDIEQARQYYYLRRLRAQKAAVRWMTIAKRKGICKDVARIIGKMVYASREVEGVWEKKSKLKKKRARFLIKL